MRGIYLSAKNDSEGFRLPVNPETVGVRMAGDGEEFRISKLGAVEVPKGKDLDQFSFESFFPAREYHFLEADFKEPDYYIEKISKWMEDKEPVRLIYVGGSFPINELVTIKTFPFDESFGSEDVNYSLSFKKFVPFGPKKMKIEKPQMTNNVASTPVKTAAVKKEAPPRQNQKTIPQTYSLVSGDSLWKVAQKYTGNGNAFKTLQQLNGIKDSQLRKLPIGLKLKIPPEWQKK